jgi:N-acetyl-anhydromuramyl-L-alanine amidase AmpD
MPMNKGDKGPAVRRLQNQLLGLGYALPRFGADGALGDETIFAVEQFRRDRGLGEFPDDLPTTVSDAAIAAIDSASNVGVAPPAGFVDATEGHKHAAQSSAKPWRQWGEITGITLHQTAGLFGEKKSRWQTVAAHVGITRAGKIFQMYAFTEVVNHANRLNSADVGIEIDGWYEGIEGKPKTLWQPPKGPKREPMQPTLKQVEACRAAVGWICDVVAANGGHVRFIHAHRQASASRQGDPGSRLWKDVGIWAQENLSLTDAGMVNGKLVPGEQFTIGSGLKIPRDWDPDYANNPF